MADRGQFENVDPHVAADAPAQFAEPLQERRITGLVLWIVRHPGRERADVGAYARPAGLAPPPATPPQHQAT
jgi:hypothetical protein